MEDKKKTGSELKRRELLLGAGAALAASALAAKTHAQRTRSGRDAARTGGYRPVVTPNGHALEYRIVGGVKVFHLTAEAIADHEFCPGLVASCWGYNGVVGGPTLEVVEGDRVRIYVTNKLPEPTTVHWHGIILPSAMDGVGGLSQRPIEPGETFRYEFTFRDAR
jgi:FtsP/CotA-like multicopper oxidase with cupredoxin domain